MNHHKIAIAQINPTVGDLLGNATKIITNIEQAKALGADIVVFPEQAVVGYPAQDQLLHEDFIDDIQFTNHMIARKTEGITAIVGSVERAKKSIDGKSLYNSALVIRDRRIVASQSKTLLPNYDVFHELRYFIPAQSHCPIEIDGIKYGIQVCEDMWDGDYRQKITSDLVSKGAQMVINISASPSYLGKKAIRFNLIQAHALADKVPFVYVNMVGGQDELVFDGGSMVVGANGRLSTQLPQFREGLQIVDLSKGEDLEQMVWQEEAFETLKLGVKDYFRKNGLGSAILGSSGGIDSAVCALVCKESLGAQNVLTLGLPTEYSTGHSISDAEELAKQLGVRYELLPIKQMHKSVIESLPAIFFEKPEGEDVEVWEENVQARLRMIVLWAYANKLGYTPICTGDKSEIGIGYYTLYGDGAGGLSVISDLTKPEVYSLARWYNQKAGRAVIPVHIIEKPASPELKPGQVAPFDYSHLSPLIEMVNNRNRISDLQAQGYSLSEIRDIHKRWRGTEFKRWQAPIALKCKPTSFGHGRIYPVTNRYVPSPLWEG